MPEAKVGDHAIWYAEHRADATLYPPLVGIHGAGGTHLDWPADIRRMPNARLILPDLPGHGRSGGTARSTVAAYADDVLTWADHLSLDPVIVMGHSMGGAIALMMALSRPEQVVGLILIGTGARLPVHPDFLAHILEQPEAIYARMAAWMWAEDAPPELAAAGAARIGGTSPEVMYNDLVACDTFDVRDRLGQITPRALVIGGSADRMTPLKFSTTLAAGLPSAELIVIDGGSHMMTLEQPAAVAGAIAGWLSRTFNA